MPKPSDRLRSVRSFKDLLPYLEDKLGWPLEKYGFDELTYSYDPSELGLKDEFAAQIKKIYQLRPLDSNQPWGIFFVEFEKKKLPVVVLRNILSHLVVKKRAEPNRAESKRWSPEDLLFISTYGAEDSDQREIAFAHFHQVEGDMPTLRVLGWDGADTPLKLDHVDATLREQMQWPKDPQNHAAWRSSWSRTFRHRIGHTIQTADKLAEVLASLARAIRDKAKTKLNAESERGPLRKLFKAFQASLIHDLTEEGFADTYAQTITYGLLTAAISRTEMSEGRHGTALIADNVADIVPVTNPFLKEMLQTFLKVGGRKGGIDFDELGIQDVVELLRGDETDLPAILRDFGNRTRGEDPVIHFYEHFLSAYNKKLKIQRGVFYTPQPVVSYIVRSVHELLQKEFRLEDGLASTVTWGEICKATADLKIPEGVKSESAFVQILDPATGTATFLVEVIEIIHRHLNAKWGKGGIKAMPTLPSSSFSRLPSTFAEYWNQYVPLALLPRLHGYELMMAPYAIAHMKIGLKLFETGYRFGSEERARIYLTNSLEPPQDFSDRLAFDAPALAHEADAVNAIKRHQRFTVVIGNPPYSNFGQLNKIPFILGLLEEFKSGLNEKKLNLDDDFIKFIRFSQYLIETTGNGLIGMITNNVFIDGITHRRMRESLKISFAGIRILDLHGSSKKLEVSFDGSKDENVFDIQQGVGISLFIKCPSIDMGGIFHADLWGTRESKYESLRSATACNQNWRKIDCPPNYFFFVPKSLNWKEEYERYPSVAGNIFIQRNAGIQTKRDGLVYSFTKQDLKEKLSDLQTMSRSALNKKYNLPEDGRDWAVQWAKEDVAKADGQVIKITYHPFDLRWTYFTGRTSGFMAYPRTPLMWSALKQNYLLLTVRNPRRGNVDSFFVSKTAVDKDSVSPFDNATFFPLYTWSEQKGAQTSLNIEEDQKTNFNSTFLKSFCKHFNLAGKNPLDFPLGLTPEDIFNYAYAVFYSPSYRNRYAEFLKIDFPRLPLAGDLELFRALARYGSELVALQLMESPNLDRFITVFVGKGNPIVEKVAWSDQTVWIDKAKTCGFKRVPENAWNFNIGGYQVCEKWLKDRKGRKLSKDDIDHYQKVVVALSETIRLMQEIDAVIEKYGGWPGAFVTNQNKESTPIELKSSRPVFGAPRPEQDELPLAAEPRKEFGPSK